MITHAVPIAALLAPLPHVELHLLPGPGAHRHPGRGRAQTVDAIGEFRADLAFLGTNGISVRHGLSTPDPEEAATKRALVESAERVIVLADATKVGQERTVRFAALEDIDVLVTDESIDAADARPSRPPASTSSGRERDRRGADRHPHRQPQLRPHGRAARTRWSAARCTGSTR